jgi:hypothetical protein
MARSLVRVWPSLVVLALLASPATADIFYVTLNNGTVMESAYQPQESSWDSSMVLLLTEVGNWVGVPKDQIEKVESANQKSGFGVRINAFTVAIGWSPNDAEDPEAQAAEGQQPVSAAEARFQQAIQNLNQTISQVESQRQSQENYSVEQFVEPGQTQGIPSGLINPYAGGTGNNGGGSQ